jgi:phage shock protein C
VSDESPSKSSGLVLIGAVVVGIGLLMLLGSFGFLPIVWAAAWWDRLRWPIVLIVAGAAVILFASRGGDAVRAVEDGPWRHGARLFRLRKDRWVAGVIGGLGRYFGVNADALRLVFLAVVLLGLPWAVGAYIILAILVPQEPEDEGTDTA